MANTYLQLAPQQGGQKFGPFQGMVQLGSHQAQCQVVLQGVHPIHAQVIDAGNGTYTVQPSQRGAELYLIRQGGSQLELVQAAVQARAGDSIVVGSQQGPCFTIQREEAAQRGAAGAGIGAGIGGAAAGLASNRMARGIGRELKRQWVSRLIAKNPAFRQIYNLSYRWRSGALMNPRYLIAAVGTVFGLIAMGFASCSGLVLALWQGVLG